MILRGDTKKGENIAYSPFSTMFPKKFPQRTYISGNKVSNRNNIEKMNDYLWQKHHFRLQFLH